MPDPDDDDSLAADLAEFAPTPKAGGRPAREERIIAGFEDIQRFVTEHGRAPLHGEGRDIFERLYAVRLDRLRALPDCRAVLAEFDHQSLLTPPPEGPLDDDALAAELESFGAGPAEATLLHVRPHAERRRPDDIANRDPCTDFDRFAPLFEAMQRDIDRGLRQTRPFEQDGEIEPFQWFVVGGQKAYVAAKGKTRTNAQGKPDARLRVVFDNGTESNLLMRSLQRALHRDEAGRRVTAIDPGPLFSQSDERGAVTPGDEQSGTIYVLRSRSDHPIVAANRTLVHKIGVTTRTVEERVANAQHDPTFLCAPVDLVATYKLFNISRTGLESLVHRIFCAARLDIEVRDHAGQPISPREWFLVPLPMIDEAITRIRDGTITGFVYDPQTAVLRAT